MAQIPSRPQNYCKRCKYTWYPRGHNVSRKCPNCGSTNIGVSSTSLIGLVFIIVVIFIIYKFGSTNEEISENENEVGVITDDTVDENKQPTDLDSNIEFSKPSKKMLEIDKFEALLKRLNNTKPSDPESTKILLSEVKSLMNNSESDLLQPTYKLIITDLQYFEEFWNKLISEYERRLENKRVQEFILSDNTVLNAKIEQISNKQDSVTLRLKDNKTLVKKWDEFDPTFLVNDVYKWLCNKDNVCSVLLYLIAYDEFGESQKCLSKLPELLRKRHQWRFQTSQKWFEIYYSEIYGFKAYKLIHDHKYDDVAKYITTSLKYDEFSGLGNISASIIEMQNYQYSKAFDFIRKVPKQYKELREFLQQEIAVLFILKMYHQALISSNKLVNLYPNDFKSYLIRAKIHQKYNNMSLAMQDVNKGLSFEPDNEELLELKNEISP